MIKKVTLLFIFFIILIAGENKVEYSKSNDLVFSKTIRANTKLTVSQNFLFNSEKNISITIENNDNSSTESKSFIVEKSVNLIDAVCHNNSDYYFVGYIKYENREYDIILIKYDPSVGIIWKKDYPQDGIEIPSKLVINNDNSIYIGGYCAIDKESYYAILTNDIQILKVNVDGNPIWVKTIGLKKVDEELLDFQVTEDNELLLLGKRKYFNDILYIAKINKFGNIAWQNTYEIGNFVRHASINHKTSSMPIEVNASIFEIEYNTKNVSSNNLTLYLNNDGKQISSSTNEDYTLNKVNSNMVSNHSTQGIIRSNSVNIRQKPLLNSAIIANLSKGDIVEIIEKTERKHRIANMNDYWYQLKINNDKTGWIYGYFIDVVK